MIMVLQLFLTPLLKMKTEWATIRIPAEGDTVGRDNIPPPSQIDNNEANDARARVDSGISGMISLRSVASAANGVQNGTHTNNNNLEAADDETVDNTNTSILYRVQSIPRRIGTMLLTPLRALESGVNNWATNNYDEVFLRQYMIRLEVEREAARELPAEREVRLKEAFVKECMVWVSAQ